MHIKVPTFAAPAVAKVASAVRPVIFQLKKHAPEILVGVGATSVVGGTVFACKATLEAQAIVGEELYDPEGGPLEEGELKQLAVKRGFDIAKGYIPAAGLVGGGIAMMVAAKSIEHNRFAAMLGAYSSLQATFDEYRARVIEQGGEELDKQLYNGAEKRVIERVEVREDGKKPKKVKEEVTVFTGGESLYHRLYDETNCPGTWRNNRENNLFFLECQCKLFNQRLQAEGRLFLNDVLKALGFDYCEAGQFVGWLASDIEGSKDGFIDFGIDYAYMDQEIADAQAENRAEEPSIWLTFNCDGEVWDKPLKKKYDL